MAGLPPLIPDQKRAVERLHTHVKARTKSFPASNRPSEPGGDRDLPFRSNALGLFGARGSGKTTLLLALREKLREKPKKQDQPGEDFCLIRTAIDCSLVPADIPLGLAIVHQVHAALRGNGKAAAPEGEDDPRSVDRLFRDVEEAYLRGDPTFRALAREMAISPRAYGASARIEIEQRLQLPRRVAAWLDAEADRIGRTGFVVLLDDVDLASPGLLRPFVWSLLDELNQQRLLLIIAADSDQFERGVSRDPSPRLDPRLARELLHKVIPLDVRVSLTPWPFDDRRRFVPVSEEKTIEEILHPFAIQGPESLRLLLPPFPRGLESLHRRCSIEATDEPPRLRILLPLLAEARGEYELGQRLATREPSDWAREFEWERQKLGSAAWDRLVRAARTQAEPLWALLPDPARLSFREAGEDACVWAEVIVDLALQSDESLGFRNLVEHHPGLRSRFSAASIHAELPVERLDAYFQCPPDTLAAEFLWISWGEVVGEVVRVEAGWNPLWDAVFEERRDWPNHVFHALAYGPSQIRVATSPAPTGGDAPSSRSALPTNVRAVVVLADALTRGCWNAISSQARYRGPGELARLAAGLVWAAFVRAAQIRPRRDLSPATRKAIDGFLEAEVGGAMTGLVSWDDEKFRRMFDLLPSSDAFVPPEEGRPQMQRELFGRFAQFSSHPVFRSLQGTRP